MQYDIDFLTPNDFDDLKVIWRMTFQDSDEVTQTFLDNIFTPGMAIASREAGIVVSAAFLIPCQLVINSRCYDAYYFYSAATHPSHRNKGHMTEILKYTKMLASQRGIDYLVLAPATDSLFDFYGRRGFWVAFYKKVVRFTREQLQSLSAEPDLVNAFGLNIFNTRQQCLGYGDFINWDEKTIKYGMLSHKNAQGAVAFTSDGYAIYDLGKNTAYVKELCTLTNPAELYSMLLLEEDVEKFTINLPVNSNIHSEDEKIVRTGMALPLNENATAALKTMRNAYLGMIF